MKVLCLFVASVGAFAQIEQPRIGVMLDQNGDARPVIGITASATLGDPILNNVLSMACSERGCLAKTPTALISTQGASADAPAGPAVFGGSYIYFPQAQTLVRWHDGALDPVAFSADGDVMALRPNGDGIDYAVNRNGATWMEHWSLIDNSLRVLGSFALARAVMLLEGGTRLAMDDGVHWVRADGTETVINAAGVQAFIAMGNGYVELVTTQGMWAIDSKTEDLFLLPGVSP